MVMAQISPTGKLGPGKEVEVSGLMSKVGAGMSTVGATAQVALVLAISPVKK
jgi:hypothetical protein